MLSLGYRGGPQYFNFTKGVFVNIALCCFRHNDIATERSLKSRGILSETL